MKRLVIASLVPFLISSSAALAQVTADAPLLDQANVVVNEKIFTQQKNGVLTDSQAARLQLRRQSIMQDAANRRSKSKGILPTSDCSRLIKQMEHLKTAVFRTQ